MVVLMIRYGKCIGRYGVNRAFDPIQGLIEDREAFQPSCPCKRKCLEADGHLFINRCFNWMMNHIITSNIGNHHFHPLKITELFFWVPGSNLRLPASYGFVPLDLDLVIVGDVVCPIRLVNHHFSPRNFRLQIQANMTNMTNMSCFMSPPYAVYSSAGSQWFPAVALLNHMLVYGPFPDRRSH